MRDEQGLLTNFVRVLSGGPLVVLDDLDPAWFRGLTSRSMAQEIERHFEALLHRPGLQVTVRDKDGPVGSEHVCRPFDYSTVPGTAFSRRVPVTVAGDSTRALASFILRLAFT